MSEDPVHRLAGAHPGPLESDDALHQHGDVLEVGNRFNRLGMESSPFENLATGDNSRADLRPFLDQWIQCLRDTVKKDALGSRFPQMQPLFVESSSEFPDRIANRPGPIDPDHFRFLFEARLNGFLQLGDACSG